MRLFTVSEVRELDRKTIALLGGKGEILMELAGAALARTVLSFKPQKVFLLCGGGNNGGDGYVAARWLKHKGLEVRVIAYREPDQLRGEARWAYESYKSCGGEIAVRGDDLHWLEEISPQDLLVDALLGTGVTPPLAPSLVQYLERLSQAQKEKGIRVVSCDLPSGIDPDTGELLAPPLRTVRTVTMGAPKLGLYSYPAREYCGVIEVVDLGYPESTTPPQGLLLVKSLLPTLRRPRTGHKGSFGTVGIIGGAKEMPGALALAALGALRAGAGKVIAITEAGGDLLLPPEAIRRIIPAWKGISAAQLSPLFAGCNVILAGPGLGRDLGVFFQLRSLLKETTAPLILDADLLWCWGEEPWDDLKGKTFLLTPHEGEAARLLGKDAKAIRNSRLKAARTLAERTGGLILLKGAYSLIVREGCVAISPFATAALAIPGSGDLLAGVIAGLCAQGLPLWEAALLGVYAHGRAGSDPSLPLGNLASELGFKIARIISEFLPQEVEEAQEDKGHKGDETP